MIRKTLWPGLRATAALAITLTSVNITRAAGNETVLHTFSLSKGAGIPFSGLAMDAAGNLYGTTELGGEGSCSDGCGVVFKLTKDSNGGFTYSDIHRFRGSLTDGGNPLGSPVLDSAGNIYGAAPSGGEVGCGVVYKLSPAAGGTYQESILHSFNRTPTNDDGCNPDSYLIFDKAGNLYGTTNKGGGGGTNGIFCLNGCGTVYRLTPNGDGTFAESVIHSFPGTPGNTDGQNPTGALAIDSTGNLWGSTPSGGSESVGTVFELTPNSDGTFTESQLYSFTGSSTGFNPFTNLVIDNAGNLYGTAENGGLGHGVVFRIAPQPGGGVQESVIHQFALCGGTVCADGLTPENGLTIDSNGNLYGAALLGGGAGSRPSAICAEGPPVQGCGVVYKLTPSAQGEFTETILYRFHGAADGGFPGDDRLVIDASGNIFGTTAGGGGDVGACPGADPGCGVVFEVKP